MELKVKHSNEDHYDPNGINTSTPKGKESFSIATGATQKSITSFLANAKPGQKIDSKIEQKSQPSHHMHIRMTRDEIVMEITKDKPNIRLLQNIIVDEKNSTISHQQLKSEIEIQMESKKIALSNGFNLIKNIFKSTEQMAFIAQMLCNHSNGNIETLTRLIEQCQTQLTIAVLHKIIKVFVNEFHESITPLALRHIEHYYYQTPEVKLIVPMLLDKILNTPSNAAYFKQAGLTLSDLKNPETRHIMAQKYSHSPNIIAKYSQELKSNPLKLFLTQAFLQHQLKQINSNCNQMIDFIQQIEFHRIISKSTTIREIQTIDAILAHPLVKESEKEALFKKKSAELENHNLLELDTCLEQISSIESLGLHLEVNQHKSALALKDEIKNKTTKLPHAIQSILIDAILANRQSTLTEINTFSAMDIQQEIVKPPPPSIAVGEYLFPQLLDITIQSQNNTHFLKEDTTNRTKAYSLFYALFQLDPDQISKNQATICQELLAINSIQKLSTTDLMKALNQLHPTEFTGQILHALNPRHLATYITNIQAFFKKDLGCMPIEYPKSRQILITPDLENQSILITKKSHLEAWKTQGLIATLTLECNIKISRSEKPSVKLQLISCAINPLTFKLSHKLGQKLSPLVPSHIMTKDKSNTEKIRNDEKNITALISLEQIENELKQSANLTGMAKIEQLHELYRAIKTTMAMMHTIMSPWTFINQPLQNTFWVMANERNKNAKGQLEKSESLFLRIAKIVNQALAITLETETPFFYEGNAGNRYQLLHQFDINELQKYEINTRLIQQLKQHSNATIAWARNIAKQNIGILIEAPLAFIKRNHHEGNQNSLIQDYGKVREDHGRHWGFIGLSKGSGSQLIATIQTHIKSEKVKASAKLCVDLIKGILELESKQHIHGQLNPQNFIKTKSAHWLNVGSTKTLDELNYHPSKPPITKYLPPDLHPLNQSEFNAEHSHAKHDVWALGIIMYEIWTGQKPYGLNSISTNNMITAIQESNLDLSMIPQPFHTVVGKFLNKDPKFRWRAIEALKFIQPEQNHYVDS